MRLHLGRGPSNRSLIIIIVLCTAFLVLFIPFYASLWYTQFGPTSPDLQKYLDHNLPAPFASYVDAPPLIYSLLNSTSPILLAPPSRLPKPSCPLSPDSPILLSLNIFSNARFQAYTAKTRRILLRRTILMGVPHAYRHLIEVKFVMGRSWDPAQNFMHDREEKWSGDMIRLNIPDGDGEKGKVAEWLRVRGAERVAQWLVKCDDDIIPILPNLIPYLLSLDSTKPTIFGSSFHTNRTRAPHFSKQMWGLSWGVVKSISNSQMNDEEKNREADEAEQVAQMMYSLPSLPGRSSAAPKSDATISPNPTSPDPRTGLIWADVGRKISPWGDYWSPSGAEALAWYNITDMNVYEEIAIPTVIRNMQAAGRRYLWDVPKKLQYLASRCKT